MPREQDPLDQLIESIVAEIPNISAKELYRALYREIGKGVIANMNDNHIDLADRSRGPVKVSGLKDRLTRAKRKIAKAG